MLEKEWRDYFIKVYVGIGIVIGVPVVTIALAKYGFDKDTILTGMFVFFNAVFVLWYVQKYVVPFLPWKRRPTSEMTQSESSEECGDQVPAMGGLLYSLNRHKRSWTGFMIVSGFAFARMLHILLSGHSGGASRPGSAWAYLMTHDLIMVFFAACIPFLWIWASKFSSVGRWCFYFAFLDTLSIIRSDNSLSFLDVNALRNGWWPIAVFWGPIFLCWAFYASRDRKFPTAAENDP